MAQQPQPQYEFHYQRVELLKTESLGIASYGAVCKAMCDDLSTLKASPKYTESVQQSQVNTKPAQSANRESREREIQQSQQIQDLQQQLHTLSDQLHTQRKGKEEDIQQQKIVRLLNLLTAANDQLQTLQQELACKDHQLQQKDAAMTACQQEMQQQLQLSEQVTAEFQQDLLEREKTIRVQQRQIKKLQQQLRQRGGQRREEVETSGAAASGGSIELTWRDGGKAPHKIWGQVIAVDGSVAYFLPGLYKSKCVFAYNSTTNEWSKLPECPNCDFSLAVVNGLLTAIGGKTPYHEVTNSLLSLTNNKWTEQFPPMPTKRWVTAAVCSDKSLVVAGGFGERYKKLSTVEVMNTETLQWSTASSLPHPLYQASATLCGDQVYMLGGFDRNVQPAKSVFTCSLAALFQSCQPQSLEPQQKSSRPKVWHQLADTPVTFSTCASLHGQLLAVGGCNSYGKTTTAIHTYNASTNSWKIISYMPFPQCQCLVAVLPRNELMVVGGRTPAGVTDTVEIATIV